MPGKACGLWVFQGVRAGLGNIPGYPKKDRQIRRYVRPADPKTPAQIFRRNLFRAAVQLWNEMPPHVQMEWQKLDNGRRVSGINAWLSYALKGGIAI
jgi:hypothetical protein